MARQYKDFRAANPSTTQESAIWIVAEASANVWADPAATDVIRLIEPVHLMTSPQSEEDAQLRDGSRSMRDAIQLREDHGEGNLVTYFRSGGAGPSPIPLPMCDTLYTAVSGTRKRGDGVKDVIQTVTTHNLRTTTFTVSGGLGVDYAVNDLIRFVSVANSADGAEGDCVRVTAVATDTITVEPGFLQAPIAGTDKVQAIITYKPAFARPLTYSILNKTGSMTKRHIGSGIHALTFSRDARGALRETFKIGVRAELVTGSDYLIGDATTDGFLTSDTIMRMADARMVRVGSYVNILKEVISSGVVSTETKAEVTAIGAITAAAPTASVTFARGSTPVAGVNLTAVTNDATDVEVAGPYSTVTNKNLRFRIDKRTIVQFDVTTPYSFSIANTPTAAELAKNLNEQLMRHVDYGTKLKGGVPFSYGQSAASTLTGPFSDVGGKLRITSPTFGSESEVQVYAATTLSLHTALFGGTFTKVATDEVTIVPWTPGVTEVSGVPQANWQGYIRVDGFKLKLTNVEGTFDNKDTWREDEIDNTKYATGFEAIGPREATLVLKGYFFGEAPRWLYEQENQDNHSLLVQIGKIEGSTRVYCWPRFKVTKFETSGGAAAKMEYTLTCRVAASSSLEDEFFHGVA